MNPDAAAVAAGGVGAALLDKLRTMPPGEKARMRRVATGEADDDLVRRGDVASVIRSLMTDPVPPVDTQAGIQMALRQVYRVDPPSHHLKGASDGE